MPVSLFPQIIPLQSSLLRINIPEKAEEVVVTFEGADQTIDRHDPLREGFGERFLVGHGYAVLSVLTRTAH